MTRMDWRRTASHLTLAGVLAAGLAAAPFAFGDDLTVKPQAAVAQSDGSNSGGSGDNSSSNDSGTSDDGAARRDNELPPGSPTGESAAAGMGAISDETADSVYEILGTTREEALAADTTTSAGTQHGQLAAYQTEVESGNLDAAAENLAAVAKDPVTEEMVTELNTELGVETTLTAKQIAEVAARKQDEGS